MSKAVQSKGRPEADEIERMVRALRRHAEGALEVPGFAASKVEAALQIVVRIEPDAVSMARRAHEELREWFLHCVGTCGVVDVELVPLLNGLKELIEKGPWLFQDSEWQPWPREEVAK